MRSATWQDTKNSIIYLFASNEQLEIKNKTIPLPIASNIIKYLGVNYISTRFLH